MFKPRNRPCRDCWHWQSFMIRCALRPEEPRLIECFMSLGVSLVEHGQISPWHMSLASLNLFLDTACDPALPWHWRNLCLDHAWRPLHVLQQLVSDRMQQRTLDTVRNRLATLRLQPSLSPSELAEGNPYE
ncbi:FagA protein [Azorhizophilus paspali]